MCYRSGFQGRSLVLQSAEIYQVLLRLRRSAAPSDADADVDAVPSYDDLNNGSILWVGGILSLSNIQDNSERSKLREIPSRPVRFYLICHAA
jgi:hypothetical protein